VESGCPEVLGERLLSLLLEEPAPGEFARRLDEIEEQAGDAQPARRQVQVARDVRTLLDRYRRRAGELAVLYDTAGDLSSLRDLETVLQSIVRRGRQLLGTDVAYLMLIDEDRCDTYMRVTEGTVTSGFMNIRLALGIGLGGLVAQTAVPQWTANYLEDRRYLHAIDGVVADERLIAILGVPLKVGRRVIGVLFAADRRPRSFAQDEVALLASLAAHAAIAIENASLFQETQAAVARLTQAKAVIEQHNRALERAAALHERLMSLVLAGGTDLDIARAVAGSLDGSVLVLDGEAKVIAGCGGQAPPEWRGKEQRALLEEAVEARRLVPAVIDGEPSCAVPVTAGDEPFGWLVFVGRTLDDADGRALERAAMVTALVRLNQRARDEAESRVRGELLAELLNEQIRDEAGVLRRAAHIGVDLSAPMTVVVAQPSPQSTPARVRADAAAFARELHGLVTTQNERVVLLVPGGDPTSAARAVARRLNRDGLRATIGAAGPVGALPEVPRYADQAGRCARLLVLLGRTGDATAVQELGLYGLLLSDAGRDQVAAFTEATLGALERYDADRRTALLPTVETWFDHDGNVARAAQALFVHPNTLYQRLDRVDAVLGCGWRSGDRAMEVRLALRLRRLAVG
jgi:PucR C-terminal helix-turn-helix domain/GAF domain/GGDEF-like domain